MNFKYLGILIIAFLLVSSFTLADDSSWEGEGE